MKLNKQILNEIIKKELNSLLEDEVAKLNAQVTDIKEREDA